MRLRYSLSSYDSLKVPAILTIGCSSDINETKFGPVTRNEYLIHYVVSGKGYFNGSPVGEGEGFLITPHSYEHYYADESDPWAYLWIISKDSEMEYFFERHEADPKTGIFHFRNKHVVEGIIERVEHSKSGCFYSSSQLTEYFLTIYNNCIYTSDEVFLPNAKVYYDFSVNYINSNLHTDLSVETLCDKLGVSQPYLYKVFKNRCGRSPKQYILDRKQHNAEQLLTNTDLSVFEVALSVGFADAFAFSRFFSKRTGSSPREFRKLRKNNTTSK